jgi:hypothetical protein
MPGHNPILGNLKHMKLSGRSLSYHWHMMTHRGPQILVSVPWQCTMGGAACNKANPDRPRPSKKTRRIKLKIMERP